MLSSEYEPFCMRTLVPLTRCGTNREYYISRIRRAYLPNANNLANFVVGRKTNYSLIVCRFFVFIKVIANKISRKKFLCWVASYMRAPTI